MLNFMSVKYLVNGHQVMLNGKQRNHHINYFLGRLPSYHQTPCFCFTEVLF